jgi:hypothetical protein
MCALAGFIFSDPVDAPWKLLPKAEKEEVVTLQHISSWSHFLRIRASCFALRKS